MKDLETRTYLVIPESQTGVGAGVPGGVGRGGMGRGAKGHCSDIVQGRILETKMLMNMEGFLPIQSLSWLQPFACSSQLRLKNSSIKEFLHLLPLLCQTFLSGSPSDPYITVQNPANIALS